MIGSVKSGALENDFARGDDSPYCFFSALRTDFQWLVVEGLMALKLNTTRVTAVCINGHGSYSLIAALIIAPPQMRDK
jgi:hypothetical protein